MTESNIVNFENAKNKKLKIPYAYGKQYFIANLDFADIDEKAFPVVFDRVDHLPDLYEGLHAGYGARLGPPCYIFHYIAEHLKDIDIVITPDIAASVIADTYEEASIMYDKIYADQYGQMPEAAQLISGLLTKTIKQLHPRIMAKAVIDKVREYDTHFADMLVAHGALERDLEEIEEDE